MGNFRKLSVVLLLGFVLLCCCAVGTYAANEYKVTIKFWDYQMNNLIGYNGTSDLWVYLEIKDKNTGETVGWNSIKLPAPSEDNSYQISFNNFGSIQNQHYADGSISFDSDTYTVDVDTARLYSGNFDQQKTYYAVHNPGNPPKDTFDNFRFLGSEYYPNKNNPTEQTMKLQQWNGAQLQININFDPASTTAITEDDGYWVRAVVEHETTDTTAYVEKLVIPSGTTLKQIIPADGNWRETQNGNLNPNEKFTGSEKNVNVQIIKAPTSTTADAIAKLDTNGAFDIIANGSAVLDYLLDNPDGTLKIKNGRAKDGNDYYTNCPYNIYLIKQTLETALTPEDILGEASEFGIIANRYQQTVHTETNFAVNSYNPCIDDDIDIDGSGNTVQIPFYIGEITGKRYDENGVLKETNLNPIITLGDGTSVHADFFVREADVSKINNSSLNGYKIHPMDPNDISAYVNGLIRSGQETSAVLASKTNLKPESNHSNYIVDTTGFPDGTTIYVDADDILDIIKNSGWKINKLPNQSIVFNITKVSNGDIVDNQCNTTSTGITIGEFWVNPNDSNNSSYPNELVQSTTKELNGDAIKNQRVDDVILSHITFNVTNATRVHLENASALFLLPNADWVTQSNGAGWILARGTVDSHAEWHFYRHARSYKAKGDFTLETMKNFKDENNNSIPFGDTKFRFNLYEADANGQILTTCEHTENNQTVTGECLIQTVWANLDSGLVDFHSIDYTETNYPTAQAPKYYVIREIIPADAKNSHGVSYGTATSDQIASDPHFTKDDIVYDASSILVKVTAVLDGADIKTTVYIDNTPVSPKQGTGNDHPVYQLQNGSKSFTNTKKVQISARKTWRNSDNSPLTPPDGTNAVFWLYQQVEGEDDAPHKTNYSVELDGFPADSVPTGNDIVGYESAAWTATFIHLPEISNSGHSISYFIREDVPAGYTASSDGPVADGGTITNTKTDTVTGSLKLEGTKTVNNAEGTPSDSRHFSYSLCYANESGTGCITDDKISIGTVDLNDGNTKDITFSSLVYDKDMLNNLVNSDPQKATKAENDSTTTWTINYILSEDAYTLPKNQKEIKVNTTKIPITVTVVDNGGDTLTCTANKGKADIAFTNTERGNFTIPMSGTKELTGRSWTAGNVWTFQIKATGDNAASAPLPSGCTTVTSTPEASSCTITNSDSSIPFGSFTFMPQHLGDISTNNGEKIYEYEVTETSADTVSGGMTILETDKTHKNFSVKVYLDNDVLKADVVEQKVINGSGSIIKFTNKYHDKTTVSLAAAKSMTNNYWPSRTVSYTFKLTGKNPDAITKLQNHTDYNSSIQGLPSTASSTNSWLGTFPAITFDENDKTGNTWKEFIFTVSEIPNVPAKGVVFSRDSYDVKITLADSGTQGVITPTVQVKKSSEDDSKYQTVSGTGVLTAATFTNSYDASGKLELSGTKQVTGNTKENRTFSFYLTYNDTNKTPVGTQPFGTVTVTDDKATNINFSEISFANFAALDALRTRFANDANQPVKQTSASPKTWQIQYILTEAEATGQSDIQKDPQEILITATITDNGSGGLNCTYTTDKTAGIAFVNYEIKSTSVSLSGKKNLSEGTIGNNKWNFTLASTDTDKTNVPVPSLCQSLPCTVQNDLNGNFNFGSFTITEAHLAPGQQPNVFTYTITESDTENPPENVSNDPNPVRTFRLVVSLNNGQMQAALKKADNNDDLPAADLTFTNTVVGANQIQFSALKKITDNADVTVAWPKDAKFDLKLEGTNDNGTAKLNTLFPTEQAKAGLTQKAAYTSGSETVVNFPVITFNAHDDGKDFAFKVSEVPGTNTSITYSTEVYNITIKPVLENGEIKLKQKQADETYLDVTEVVTLSFGNYINKYNASGQLTLSATKSMTYGYWPQEAEFKFKITDGWTDAENPENNKTNVPAKVSDFDNAAASSADSLAKFELISFDQKDIGKTFYFTIEETDKTRTDIDYSDASYRVSVTVGDNGDGTLNFTVKKENGDPITIDDDSASYITGNFVNTYNAEGEITLQARKRVWDADGILEGNSETHIFHFILRHAGERDTILQSPIRGTVTTTTDSKTGAIKDFSFHMDEIIYNMDLLHRLENASPALASRSTGTDGKIMWTIEYLIEEDTNLNNTEDNADIDLDHMHLPVTVQVVDNGNGTLTCTQMICTDQNVCTPVTGNTLPLFENHEIHEGSAIIKGKKILSGRPMTADDTWTFTLAPHSDNPNAPMPDNCGNPCTTTNNTNGEFAFPPIHFTPELLGNEHGDKVYKYTVTESRGNKDFQGVTDDGEKTREITITAHYDSSNEEITVTANPDVLNYQDRITFTNSYTATGKVKLKVTKAMSNGLWPAKGSFKINLVENENNNPQKYTLNPTVSVSNGTPAAVFASIEFDQNDINKKFIFTISENTGTITCASGSETCITYDPAVYTVTLIPQPNEGEIRPTVTVKNNSTGIERTVTPTAKDVDGAYIVPVSINDNSDVTFTNTYTASGSTELEVIKALGSNSNWPEGKNVEFTLKAVDGAPMPEGSSNGKKVITLGEPGEGSFGTITYSYTGIEVIGKKYIYEITETKGFGDGWTVSPSSITATVRIVQDNGDGTLETAVKYSPENNNTFTNSYETKGSLVLSAEKAFNRWDMVDSFTFKLETDYKDYVDQKTVRKDSPVAEFKQIDFSKFDDGKERTFTISEVMPNPPINGVVYAEPIVISITPKDNGDGTMTLYSSGKELPKDDNGVYKLNVGTLTNTYHSAGAGVIQVAKVLEGREWNNDDTYTFTLEAVDGAPMPGKTSVTITKDTAGQTDAFEEIPFSEPGTYKYIVKETECSVKGVTCDKTDKTVTFKVERNEKGEIVAAADSNLIQDVSFTNTYNAEGKLNLKSSKRIENNDDTFEKHLLPFVLYHKYDGKNDYPDGKPVIERIVEVEDGTLTDFDYPIYYSVDEVPGSADPSDGKREILKKLVSDGYAKVISTTDDTNTRWEVGYFLTELPAIDHQLKPPTQSFDILVTISDSGTGELKVEKVRVQALNEKGEIVEPFKDISDNDGFAIGPFVNTERKDFFTELLIGTKILEGRDLTAADNGKWRVTISSEDENAPLPQEKTVPIEISEENGVLKGSFAFAPITFKPEHLGKCIPDAEKGYVCGSKDYHYTLTESGNAVGIINGPALKFIIRVSEAEDGHVQADFVDEAGNILSADRILAAMTFTNTTRSFTEGDAEIAVEKVFNGEWPDGLGFTFTITPLNEAPMSERSAVTVTKDDPSGSFGKIRITVEDMTDESGAAVTEKSFSYEIREVIPEGADPNGIYQGIQYDTRVRTVTISARIEGDSIIMLSPADQVISETFTNRKIEQETPEGPIFHRIETMPRTGFSALRPSVLKEQPKDLIYRPMAFTLQIPSLDITADIVEVPFADGEYPVEWLGSSAGLLEGYALPGEGQTFITGHNHLNTMEAGPFALLNEMGIGDRIFVVDSEDKMQIFTVYANEKVAETDIRGLERIAGQFNNSLTLITCEDEMESGGYANRRIIACKPVNK